MFLQCDANEFPVLVCRRISIVANVARRFREECVIPAHAYIFSRKPKCASLAIDDITRNDILTASLFGTQTPSSALLGLIRSAFGFVCRVSDRDFRGRDGKMAKRRDPKP